MSTLGWNDGTTQELFTRQELIEKFDLSRIQKSGAKFDEERLIWMNGQHIRSLDDIDLLGRVKNYWPKSASSYDDKYKLSILELIKDRLKYFEEIPRLTIFFFEDLPFDKDLIKNNLKLKDLSKKDINSLIEKTKTYLSKSDFSQNDLSDKLNDLLKSLNQTPSVLFSLIRIATTNASASPELAGSLSVLGKEKSIKRIDQFISDFNANL